MLLVSYLPFEVIRIVTNVSLLKFYCVHSFLLQMRQSLEVRLEEAEREIKAAEQERIDKEEYAQKSLAYENSNMEKVVQESKILQQEAEKNSEVYLASILPDIFFTVFLMLIEILTVYKILISCLSCVLAERVSHGSWPISRHNSVSYF